MGAIYPTSTKVKTVLTSTETLDAICRAVPIPANAIGGLNKSNVQVLKGIGIGGICVVSTIMKAEDPRAEAEILRSLAGELIACRHSQKCPSASPLMEEEYSEGVIPVVFLKLLEK